MSKLIATIVAFRNSLYWRLVATKNAIYWHFYYSKNFGRFVSVKNNFKNHIDVFFNYLFAKVLAKKVFVVFLLVESHYSWVQSILDKLKSQNRLNIQFFSPVKLGKELGGRNFYTGDLVPTKGIQLLPSLRADLYMTPASTTAQNAPFSGPKLILMHSLVSIHGVYEDNTFDEYDYIFCAGKHHLEEFRDLFISKGLTGKCLIPGGYPKLDELLERSKKIDAPKRNCVIFAPTLLSEATESVTLMFQSEQLVAWFLENGWFVLFRPHPINLEPENKYYPVFVKLINCFSDNYDFEVDRTKDYFDSYAQSTLMVSDISGTAYTYSLGFCRPVVFFDKSTDSSFALGLLYKNRHRIGRSVSSASDLPDAISFLMTKYVDIAQEIESLRGEYIFNVGRSAEYFANNVEFVINRIKHPDWVYV